VQIQTFSAYTTTTLDRKVNEFLARPDVDVRQLHAAMSFGVYMVAVEYDQR
jgi:hypothetical protein